jgi:glycosyltransferase involved in cell wall biosynthesis
MWLVTRKDNKFSIIVTVKNQADEVENIIRSIAWNAMNGLKCAGVPHILVVDMGSDDDTFEVLEALSRDYSFIECTNDKNCAELIMGLHFREQ